MVEHLVVMMMKADNIESERGKPFRDDSRSLFVGELGISNEVRAIEPDRRLRTVAEDELSIRSGDHRSIFSGGSVKTGGEIQRTAGQNVPAVWERFPIFPRFGDIGRPVDRTEFRSEFSALAVTDPEIQFCIPDFLHSLIRQKPDPHSIGRPLPFASVLNSEIEFAFQKNFSAFGRETELPYNSVEYRFLFVFCGERVLFAVDFKPGSGILQNRKRRGKAEVACQRSVFKIYGPLKIGAVF